MRVMMKTKGGSLTRDPIHRGITHTGICGADPMALYSSRTKCDFIHSSYEINIIGVKS
jgi:hypothetical protein